MKIILKTSAVTAALAATVLSGAQGPHAKISTAKAEGVAKARYHGRVTGKTELENEDGKWQYSVMVRTGKVTREVMVDSNTGKIASVEVVSAKEEAQEKAMEAKRKKGARGGPKRH